MKLSNGHHAQAGVVGYPHDGLYGVPGARKDKDMDLRKHEAQTTRNLVIGFFGLLLAVGGGLILLFYGPLGLGAGVICIGAGAALFGLVLLVTFSFGWIADWLERRDS